MASGADSVNTNNKETSEELNIIHLQLKWTVIELSRIQKEQFKEIRKIASGQSDGKDNQSKRGVLEIAAQSLQEELINLQATRTIIERSNEENTNQQHRWTPWDKTECETK